MMNTTILEVEFASGDAVHRGGKYCVVRPAITLLSPGLKVRDAMELRLERIPSDILLSWIKETSDFEFLPVFMVLHCVPTKSSGAVSDTPQNFAAATTWVASMLITLSNKAVKILKKSISEV